MLFSVALRSVLVFQNSPLLDRILLLLFLWLPALLADILYGRQLRWLAVLSISMEFLLTQYLLLVTQTDFFAFLFAIPCMQVMQRFSYKAATALVALSTLLIFLTLLQPYSLPFSLATAVVYFGGSLFLVTYIESIRRAGAIEEQQQVLAMQLKQANDQMVLYSSQRKQLAAVRERQRLVRELHDSVTQTIFSMTLTTQSALMLLDHDRNQVAVLLDRLDHLTHGGPDILLNVGDLLLNDVDPVLAHESAVKAGDDEGTQSQGNQQLDQGQAVFPSGVLSHVSQPPSRVGS